MTRMQARGLMLGAFALTACKVQGWQPDHHADVGAGPLYPQDANAPPDALRAPPDAPQAPADAPQAQAQSDVPQAQADAPQAPADAPQAPADAPQAQADAWADSGRGVVDGAAGDAPGRWPACAQGVDIATTHSAQGSGALQPSCTLDSDGAVVLEYSDLQCPVGKDAPFRGCEFAWHQNLQPFDPLQGHGGVFEIFFCVSGPVNGAINVWYQEGDCEECRYSLPLLAGDETLVGCRKIYLTPEDVGRDVPWHSGPYCRARDYASGVCVVPTDAGDKDAADASITPSRPDASGFAEAGSAEAGTALDAAPVRPRFSDSKLVLMQEWCDSTKPAPADGATARITLKSVVYHPAQCLCTDDQDCAEGRYCQTMTWPGRACCACGGCPGLCR